VPKRADTRGGLLSDEEIFRRQAADPQLQARVREALDKVERHETPTRYLSQEDLRAVIGDRP
jgi:hypothetical protein